MKRWYLLLPVLLALLPAAWATNYTVTCWTAAGLMQCNVASPSLVQGDTLTVQVVQGAAQGNMEYVFSGPSPSSVSITAAGCGKMGTCNSTPLSTFTSTSNGLAGFQASAAYPVIKITVGTLTSGTSVTVGTTLLALGAGNSSGGSSGPSYDIPFSFTMVGTDNTSITGTSPIVLVSNVGASDVTYEFSFSWAQTALGSGGSCGSSNVFTMLCYTDADSGVAVGGNCEDNSESGEPSDGRLTGYTVLSGNSPEYGPGPVALFSSGNPGLGTGSRWTVPRFLIRVKAGSAIEMQEFQNNHGGCSTQPIFEARPLLFGPF
jgi:hypothetical protein